MEPECSLPSHRDSPEKNPTPAQTEDRNRQRVSGSEILVMECDLVGLGQSNVETVKLLDQIHKKVSSFLESSLEQEEIEDEKFTSMGDLLKERAMEVEERERKLWLSEKRVEEVMEELEEKRKEIRLIDESVKDKMIELEKKEEALEAKQREIAEDMELKRNAFKLEEKKLEEREKEISFMDEAVKEKLIELEKKEEIFVAKQNEKAKEMELKRKVIELEEKKLEEREKEIELKQRELEERSETCKRSRVKLLVEKSSEADSHHIRPAKRHKHITKETDSTCLVSASVEKSEAYEGDTVSIDETSDEEDHPEPIVCADSEFNDFEKTMSSFAVGQTWALYDHIENMPRWYGRIKKVIKYKSSVEVTWLVPKDEVSVPVACGRFKYGTTETISHLAFSHEMHPIRRGRHFIAVNPRKGETWALFRDWNKNWNNDMEQHELPYRYDFVEVSRDFDDVSGVGVAYLGKVEGFTSVFKRAAQRGVLEFMISPEEMQRFSHRVPSFRLSGEEKEGVPVDSFELDPAAGGGLW